MKRQVPIRGQFLLLSARCRRRFKNDTQELRENLLEDLKEMFKLAKEMVNNEKSKGENAKPKQIQQWVRIMGYIGQVINSLSKSFEEAKALEQIERLEKMIDEAGNTKESQQT